MTIRNLSGAVDFTVLEAMTGGLDEVTLEVLDIYVQQAALWAPLLDISHEGCNDALHTLRGASAGIGANALAALCAVAEGQSDPNSANVAVGRVLSSLNQTLSDVAAYRHGLLLRSLKA